MDDLSGEIVGLRLDIETVRAMIDGALDRGPARDETFLRACAEVLYDKRCRLDELEGVTLYVSRGDTGDPLASRDTVGWMPERLDHITIELSRGDVTLTWDTRQALLARLQHVQSASNLRATFEAVGATRPVELNPAQRATLLGLLDEWSTDARVEAMPAELNDLRDALRNDLADLA